jgi:hypothetical protein
VTTAAALFTGERRDSGAQIGLGSARPAAGGAVADALVAEDPGEHRSEQQDHGGDRQQREAQAGRRPASRSVATCGLAAESQHEIYHLSYLVNHAL